MLNTLTRDPHTERLAELTEDAGTAYLPHFLHEDGSHTFIVRDDDAESPRNDDGNVSRLVVTNRDNVDLDEGDAGLEAARERWDWLEHNGHAHYQRPDASGSWHTDVDRTLVRLGLDRDALVTRYVAMFRPDILSYRDEWSVNGTMQGHWNAGWAYVTRADWDAVGFTPEWLAGRDITPDTIIDQEVRVYGQWFAGEVFGVVHVKQGDPIVVYGEQGAYVDGYEADEDAVWGFIGDDYAGSIGDVTSSPIVEKVTA